MGSVILVAESGFDSQPPQVFVAAGVFFLLFALINFGVSKSVERHGDTGGIIPREFRRNSSPRSSRRRSAFYLVVGLGFLVLALIRALR